MRTLLLCFAILAGCSVFAGGEEHGLEEIYSEDGKLNWMETMDLRTKRTSEGKKTKEMSMKKALGKQKSSQRKDLKKKSRAKNNNKRFIRKNENKKKTNKRNKGQKKTKKKIQNENKKKTNKRNKGQKETKKTIQNENKKKANKRNKVQKKSKKTIQNENMKNKNKRNKGQKKTIQKQNKKANKSKSRQKQIGRLFMAKDKKLNKKQLESKFRKQKIKGKVKNFKTKSKIELRRTINKLRKTISKMSENRKDKNLCRRQQNDSECDSDELQAYKLSTKAETFIRTFKRGTRSSIVLGKKNDKSSKENIFGIAAQKIEDIVIYPEAPKCSRNANERAKKNITENYYTLKKCNETVSAACSSSRNKRLLRPASACNVTLSDFKRALQICRDSSIYNTTQKRCDCTRKLNSQTNGKEPFKSCTTGTGEISVFDKENKAQKKACLDNFQACKQAEDRSADLLEACVGGKPENNDPNSVSIGQIRRGINNRRDGTVRCIEMDIFENTQFFTQTTTYYELGDYVEIIVPKHGYPPRDIIASTTYYLNTGTNDTIFDTQIIKTENGSYLSDISIVKSDILLTIDIVVGSNRMDAVQSSNITTKKGKTKLMIPRKLDEIEKNKLPQLIQDLVKNNDVFTYSTYEVSEEEITTIKLMRETYPDMFIIKNYTEMEDDAFSTPTGYGFSARNALETIGPYGRNRQDESHSDCNGVLKDILYETIAEQCSYTYTKPNGKIYSIEVAHDITGIPPPYQGESVQCCGNKNRPKTPAKCWCREAYKCFTLEEK